MDDSDAGADERATRRSPAEVSWWVVTALAVAAMLLSIVLLFRGAPAAVALMLMLALIVFIFAAGMLTQYHPLRALGIERQRRWGTVSIAFGCVVMAAGVILALIEGTFSNMFFYLLIGPMSIVSGVASRREADRRRHEED